MTTKQLQTYSHAGWASFKVVDKYHHYPLSYEFRRSPDGVYYAQAWHDSNGQATGTIGCDSLEDCREALRSAINYCDILK